jgi:hypothetical protein
MNDRKYESTTVWNVKRKGVNKIRERKFQLLNLKVLCFGCHKLWVLLFGYIVNYRLSPL